MCNCIFYGINVVEASYGKACGDATGNVTNIVGNLCNGQTSCNIFVQNGLLGDPFYQCPKDFRVVWSCDGNGANSAYHERVSGERYYVMITCP